MPGDRRQTDGKEKRRSRKGISFVPGKEEREKRILLREQAYRESKLEKDTNTAAMSHYYYSVSGVSSFGSLIGWLDICRGAKDDGLSN